MKIREIIDLSVDRAVNETIHKLKAAGFIRIPEKTVIGKTEELLYDYPIYRNVQGKDKTAEIVSQIEQALAKIKHDPYYDIIEYYFFQRMTIEGTADALSKNPRTIIRNKRRLVKTISHYVFSDEMIDTLFL